LENRDRIAVKQLIKRRSRKAGLPPGTPMHIGERRSETSQLTVVHYDAGHFEERHYERLEEATPMREPSGVTWAHVTGVHDSSLLERVGKEFGLHPLVVEDIQNTDQRAKIEDYGSYAYVVIRLWQDGHAAHGTRVEQVSLVLGQDFVLTFEEAAPGVFESVRQRLRDNRGRLRAEGADYLAYSLLDAAVDSYFGVLEELGERIESLEDTLIAHPSRAALQTLHTLKREMIGLRRSVWPLRDVIGGLERSSGALVRKETWIYLRDVYDHAAHVIDTIETYRDTLSGMLDVYMSSVSNRLNEVMKVLTIIATIFMPLTFIAGIYGMNFKYMPELEWRFGYPFVLGIMIGLGLAMLWFFRKKKWL